VADGFSGVFNVEAGHSAFGCGGTVTALARLHLCEAPRKDSNAATIDRSILSIETVDGLFDRLTGQSLTERVAFTGLSTERAQIIPAGAALLSGLMHQLHLDELQVHEHGIRTGLLFDVAQR
jgi:exopolyphosphatase/guanosine-5'-triphosphate,3'-diphosphate pyrophosphatase